VSPSLADISTLGVWFSSCLFFCLLQAMTTRTLEDAQILWVVLTGPTYKQRRILDSLSTSYRTINLSAFPIQVRKIIVFVFHGRCGPIFSSCHASIAGEQASQGEHPRFGWRCTECIWSIRLRTLAIERFAIFRETRPPTAVRFWRSDFPQFIQFNCPPTGSFVVDSFDF